MSHAHCVSLRGHCATGLGCYMHQLHAPRQHASLLAHLLNGGRVAIDDIRLVTNAQQSAMLPSFIIAEAAIQNRTATHAVAGISQVVGSIMQSTASSGRSWRPAVGTPAFNTCFQARLSTEPLPCNTVLGSSAAALCGECLARCFFAFDPPAACITAELTAADTTHCAKIQW
jgi:hypothetical protein